MHTQRIQNPRRFALPFIPCGGARLLPAAAIIFFTVLHAPVAQAACAVSGSSASANGGSTCNASGTLSGGSPALSSTGTGSVLDGTALVVTPTTGGGGIAAIASGGGIINLDFPSGAGSSITLSGGGGDTALEATGAGSAINANNLTLIDNAQVTTPGLAWATAGGTITLLNSAITANVSGGEAGLEADTGGTINTTNTNVIFSASTGGGEVGVKAMTGSSINMTGGSVQLASGGGNLGLDAVGGTITGSGLAIIVGNSGGGAGVEATNSGTISLTNNSTITTSGAGTPGGELINGGTINMTGGTVTTQTAGSDGFLVTNGGAADTLNLSNVTVSAGGNSFHVNNGSIANITLDGVTAVTNNGTVLLTEGGGTDNLTASDSTLTGVMTTAGGSTANVALQAATLWTMTGNSNVTNLTNADSTINYTPPTGDPTQLSSYKTLTANNYVGDNGTIGLNTYLAADGAPSDLVVINGGTATGSTTLHITNTTGPGAETQANGILVVSAVNNATTAAGSFSLNGQEVRAGAFSYYLFQGGVNGSVPQDWFLRSSFTVPLVPAVPLPPGALPPPITDLPEDPPPETPGGLPPGTYPIIGPEIATYGAVQPLARELGLAVLGTLHDRIGNTLLDENAPCADSGDAAEKPILERQSYGCASDDRHLSTWARVFGQSIDNSYLAFAAPSTSGQLVGFQGGLDLWRGALAPGHRDDAGLYLSYANAYANVSGFVTNAAASGYVFEHTGAINLNAWSAGGYWTHYGPTGWYLDAVVQGTRYDGAASTQFASLDPGGYGLIGSLEGGYPIPLPLFGAGFVIEPQGQIIGQRVAFDAANDAFGAVDLGATDGVTGRLGLRGQWSIETASGQEWQPYLRANFWRDWGGAATTLYSGVDEVPLAEAADRLQFGGGLTMRLNAAVSLYANADYQFAVGDTTWRRDAVSGAAGFRYSW